MRIVIDVTPLSHPRTGIGNYILGMLQGLAEVGGHELALFAPTGPRNVMRLRAALNGIPGDRRLVVVPPPSNVWRKLWSRWQRLPVEWLTGPLDVFHFSDWMYPPQRAGVRATTFHDLGPIHHPEWVDERTRALHVPKAQNAAKTCDVIVAISEFTADDVAERLGYARERIVVAYPGVDERFSPQAEPGDYILMLQRSDPRKNYANLAAAVELLPDLRLVAPDHVSDDELPALYRGAAVFAYPSFFEGFGMPALEAMASGIPVVASSHPSLDEATGDAAVRVDPDSPESIAEGIEQALRDRDRLVGKGLEHAKRFTWRACGEAHLRGWSRLT